VVGSKNFAVFMKAIYLVINPATPKEVLLAKLALALQENLYAVQIWDNFTAESQAKEIVPEIIAMCNAKNTPILINNRWQYLQEYPFSGVHFDNIPAHWQEIKKQLPKNCLLGITANNDLEVVKWAVQESFSYISFCSMFPSVTANSCELVSFETILQARKMTHLPIFLAGGISVEKLAELRAIQENFDGIALVSGIMSAENPQKAIQNYQQQIQTW
jgi:thiamine-phosphate pyrophosphorylase